MGHFCSAVGHQWASQYGLEAQNKGSTRMPLVRMKAAPVKTDGERLGNEFMNGVFCLAQIVPSDREFKAGLHALQSCPKAA